MVHSLIYHFGLLDLPADPEEEDEEGPEVMALLRRFGGGNYFEEDESPSAPCHTAHVDTTAYQATKRQLQVYHSSDYIDSLLNDDLNTKSSTASVDKEDESYNLLDDCPRFPLLSQYITHLGGTVIHAAEQLSSKTYDVAIIWDGGRHHAHKSKAAGFCYINDAVLAIMELRKPRKVVQTTQDTREHHQSDSSIQAVKRGSTSSDAESVRTTTGFGARPEDILRASQASSPSPSKRRATSSSSMSAKRRIVLERLSRILYLDLDLHWGDGVEEAFSNTSSVLTISIHNESLGFYPVPRPQADVDDRSNTSTLYSLKLPLKPGTSSKTYKEIFTSCILPVIESYAPESIVVQCGLDTLQADPMNIWNLDLHTVLFSISTILDYIDGKQVSLMLLGGGGYHSANTAKGWAAITALMLGRVDVNQWEQSAADDGGIGLLHAQSTIPHASPLWTEFEPDYTLDVPAGNRQDTENTPEDIKVLQSRFADVAKRIQDDQQRN
ncbi:unnamed protein product [Sympodiomycopsis kandeliae]